MRRINDVQPLLDGIIHWDTQQAPRGADLTVGHVYRLTGPGQLDFGGSEFAEAPREQLTPTKADPEDSYGWWRLDAGTYIVRYNEQLKLADGHIAHITPLHRLVQAGAHHPSIRTTTTGQALETLLTVGSAGCHLKENARISLLEIFQAA